MKTQLISILFLIGCQSGQVKKENPCPDKVHFCYAPYICTPDNKSCTSEVNWCSDKNHWCSDGLICTPDNNQCVSNFSWCPDRYHWCNSGLTCSKDNMACQHQSNNDIGLVLPVIILTYFQ
jgi:hypothetical protein